MIENLENEVWMPIAGYEGLYEISNYSRIKSTKFKLHRILNPNTKTTKKSRYIKCRLYNEFGECEIIRNHRLGAMCFVPNPKPGIYNEVNHKDGDRDNNHVSNFEWTDHRSNVLHGKITKGKSSQFTGVSYYKSRKNRPWVAKCYLNNKENYLGAFDTEIEASEAYRSFVKKNNLPLNYVV